MPFPVDSFLIDVPAPAMGATIHEIAVVRLYVAVGDEVIKGSRLALLETDKAIFDFESPCDGSVSAVPAPPGTILSVGQPLIRLLTTDGRQAHLQTAVHTSRSEFPRPPTSRWEFCFGDPRHQGFTFVPPTAHFSPEAAYGFEPQLGGAAAAPRRFCVRLSEGNYSVDARFGDLNGPADTVLFAQTRRLAVPRVCTAAGEIVTRTFSVNVRNSVITGFPAGAPGGNNVWLKNRERVPDGLGRDWSETLAVEIGGARPALQSLRITPAGHGTTVFLLGDSTVSDEPNEAAGTWGQMLPAFLAPPAVVANHAAHGETLKSFIYELRLAKVLSVIRPGDHVLIQFGHGDQKRHWTHTYLDAATTYRSYLRVFAEEVRSRQGCPLLVTPVQRLLFETDGCLRDTLADYTKAMREVARLECLPLIDLSELSTVLFEALGPERAKEAFFDADRDQSHHSAYGGYELAQCVVSEIRRIGGPLAAWVRSDTPVFHPSHPDSPEAVAALLGRNRGDRTISI